MTPTGTALFDPTGAYRYLLTRVWNGSGPLVTWVMLNPSTATATTDDPTIRRVIGLSTSWGFGAARVVNLFAHRARCPGQLRSVDDPVGPGNDDAISNALEGTEAVIAAWGNHGTLPNPRTGVARSSEMEDLLGSFSCLGLTKQGQPRHPLYLPSQTKPVQLT